MPEMGREREGPGPAELPGLSVDSPWRRANRSFAFVKRRRLAGEQRGVGVGQLSVSDGGPGLRAPGFAPRTPVTHGAGGIRVGGGLFVFHEIADLCRL